MKPEKGGEMMHNTPFYNEQWSSDYYARFDHEEPLEEPLKEPDNEQEDDETCYCDECGNGFSQAGHTGWAIKCLDGSVLRLCSYCFRHMSKEDLLDLVGVTYTNGYGEEVEAVATGWETEKRRKETVFATPKLLNEAV